MFMSYLISIPALIRLYVYVLSYFHPSFDPLLCLFPILRIYIPALIHYYVYVLSYLHPSFDPLLCLCPIVFPSQL